MNASSYKPLSPLFLRFTIGIYFILLGVWAFIEPELSIQAVQRYSNFSKILSQAYVTFGLYIFFAAGLLLFFGLFTKGASLTGIVLLLPLLYGAGIFTPEGDKLVFFLEKRTLFKDLVVLAGCASIYMTGPGALSLDGILRGLYGNER